jgi:hypothetical protein
MEYTRRVRQLLSGRKDEPTAQGHKNEISQLNHPR